MPRIARELLKCGSLALIPASQIHDPLLSANPWKFQPSSERQHEEGSHDLQHNTCIPTLPPMDDHWETPGFGVLGSFLESYLNTFSRSRALRNSSSFIVQYRRHHRRESERVTATTMTSADSSPCKKRRTSSGSIAYSTSSTSSYFFDSGSRESSIASEDQLMANHVDPAALQKSMELRRRIKQVVFKGNDIDWRSIPTIYDDGYMRHVLARIPHLRCQSGEAYLAIVMNDFRMHKPSSASTTGPDFDTVVIDGEEMVDMIG
jgi:hypothetical protein